MFFLLARGIIPATDSDGSVTFPTDEKTFSLVSIFFLLPEQVEPSTNAAYYSQLESFLEILLMRHPTVLRGPSFSLLWNVNDLCSQRLDPNF